MGKIHDVIVIGSGVSGSYVSSLLAKKGLDVLSIEQSMSTKKDSGIVSTGIRNLSGVKQNEILKKIRQIRFVSPSGKSFMLKSDKPFAYILKRDEFEKRLRKDARRSGASILYRKCSRVAFKQDYAEVYAKKKYRAKIVMGCDGAASVVRRCAGIEPPRIYHALLSKGSFRKDEQEKHTEIEVFMNKHYSPGFFAWSIPFNRETGLVTKHRPFEHLDYFNKSIGFEQKEMHASVIPIGPVRSYSDRCMLVGDSCGQVKPVSGGGIIYSMICAQKAADAADAAFQSGRFDSRFLKRYEKSWKKEIWGDMKLQLLARKIYRKAGNNDIERFFSQMGSHIEDINSFDYDKFSTITSSLPKLKLFWLILTNIYLFFEWSYE